MKQMIRWNSFLSSVLLTLCLAVAPTNAWQSDNGDGTFTNPVLYADYPDPDGYVDVDSFTFDLTAPLVDLPRGRPILNPQGTTFIADTGHLLRGPFATTEWGSPPSSADIEAIKNMGCNAIHHYAECFDPTYPAAGSTAPGYAASRVDQMVQRTRDSGLYLIITIGNGANNGTFNAQYITNFWTFYAPRYKNETHVIYEIQNEPHAWSAPYPKAALDMEANAYTLIRSLAPDTPILLFSFAVLGSGPLAVADIQSVSTAASIDWSNAAVAVHGYAGTDTTTTSLNYILNAGYPCFLTEFYSHPWGNGSTTAQDIMLTASLERLGVSWLNFLSLNSREFFDANRFTNRIDQSGLSWNPDYGTWPMQRGVYGNGGIPRSTTGLTGTLRIQAEDYDTGGQGIAYSDTDTANQGGQYRTSEGVDIESTADSGGGYDVGWTSDDEWLEYTIIVTEPGMHNLRLRVAGPSAGEVQAICNGEDKTGIWTLPTTGGLQTWTTTTNSVFLEPGQQKLHIQIITGGFNLNWIELSPANTGAIGNGTYKFLNRNSGMAAEADTANHEVQQNTYLGTSIQKWTIQHRGAGQYSIVSASNGWSWSTFYDRNEEPLSLAAWGYDGNADRRFIIIPTDNGYYRFVVVDGGLSIEITGASLASSAPAQQYEYKGGSHQQWGILSPSAPAFPTGLNAKWISSSQINLTWTASSGAMSYNVKRSTASGGPYLTLDTNVTTTSYSDTAVVSDTIYYYVVSANTAVGESLNSNEAEASRISMHAYLNFDETRGTTATDVTTNGWTGTLVNGPLWKAGKYNNAVDLDGTNDYVRLPTGVVDGLTDFTVAAWVYLDAVSTWSRVFDFGTGTSVNMFLTPRNGSTNTVRFAITTSGAGGEQQINGTAALPSGAWTHVAVTLSSSTGILYVNGAEVGRNGSMSLTPDSLGATTQNYIGKSQYADPYLNGRVDDFRIYSSALSPSEVGALASNDEPYFTCDPVVLADGVEGVACTGQTLAGFASDPDSDPLTFSKVSGPAWLTIAVDGTIFGTPSDSDVGFNVFTVRVDDTGGLYDMAEINIYVANIYSGVRGVEDLEGFTAQWLISSCVDTPACDGADLDGDKDVDFFDFALLAEQWIF